MKTFNGQKLKELREAQGLTLEVVGSWVHRTRAAVNCWERGKADPPKHVLPVICEKLGVQPDIFLS